MDMANWELACKIIPIQIWNTLYMVTTSTFFSLIIGLPLAILLALTARGQMKQSLFLYKALAILINVGRSFPFAILMVALIPFTRWIVGTSLGTTATIVPLTIAAAPFVARIMEMSLRSVDAHIIEAATVMGSSTKQIIFKVLLPEALPSLITDATTTMINLIGYSAMAGLVGGGGLGQVAIQYGYQRFNTFIMILTVLLLIIMVQAIQWVGTLLSDSINHKRGT